MWNPKKDIVDFFENHSSSLHTKGLLMKPVTLLSMFARQFPFETTEVRSALKFSDEIEELLTALQVRYISLPSRYWAVTSHMSNTVAWPLIDYISLRQLVVVVDREFELARVQELEAGYPTVWRVWTLPDDLNQNLQDIRDHYERWWPERHPLPKQPSVRVVMDANGIFNGEDRHINLRCHPCLALGV
jgi:hypothetical protein